MQDSIPVESSHFTPKRKRDTSESLTAETPSPSRLRTTNLPTRPLLVEGSPRTVAAGHLEGLDLDPKNQIPPLDVTQSTEIQVGRFRDDIGSSEFKPHISLPSQTFHAPVTPPPSSDGPSFKKLRGKEENESTKFVLEIPKTPRLRPVYSPTPPLSATKPRSSQSPSPSSIARALWWSDNEITGHDPKDPSDDGYGINGIGFLPTAAIANSRVEKRKKQVAEWRNREARDARQIRNDRRRKRDADTGASTGPVNHEKQDSRIEEGRKVRFLDI